MSFLEVDKKSDGENNFDLCKTRQQTGKGFLTATQTYQTLIL